jgi:serine/threonine protein phosphatase PrpC
VQYDRLMGKCLLSRCIGQFEYKNLEDYENQMKGPVKSLLSCIPDVCAFDLNCETDEFILLTTDGILDVMNICDIVSFVGNADRLYSQSI